ncbi:MAG: hypothetical protein ACI81W_001324, partial [Saprospiraceae bacterium]
NVITFYNINYCTLTDSDKLQIMELFPVNTGDITSFF